MSQLPYLGEICALAAPLGWSFAVILFRVAGLQIPAVALNAFKNLLGCLLFLATVLLIGGSPMGIDAGDYLLLLVSGVLGMAVSDTLFFKCLNRLGAGLQAIVSTSYAPLIILLSILFLDERLRAWQWLGVALITGAVVSVGWAKDARGERDRRTVLRGTAYGLSAMLVQAVSVTMVKPLLNTLTESAADDASLAVVWLVWATCWRLVGGTVASTAQMLLTRRARQSLCRLRDRRTWTVMIAGSVLGTYISLLLWMGGFMWTHASVASALNQSATLFTFILAAWLLKEPVTRLRLAGLALGVGGVVMVTFG